MRSTFALLSVAGLALADYDPFAVPYLYAKQPNGNPDGQTNYYTIEFNVTSINGDSPQSAYCWASWGDNNNICSGSSCVPYSTAVPSGYWIQCAHNASNIEDTTSEFAFQLYPFFSIGNFTVAFQQNFTTTTDGLSSETVAESIPYTIRNTTSAYTCEIDPIEVQYEQHASGTCSTPAGSAGFSIPVATEEPACTHASSVALSFPVQEVTAWGDNIFVVGNISELGNWNPYDAVALNADEYSSRDPLWTGGQVSVAAGTAFGYKYIQWNADGSLLWECDENRVFAVSAYTCGTEIVGNDPDYFRCGNH